MAISVTCSCGRRLKAPDTIAGRRARCPACGVMVTVPIPSTQPARVSFGRSPADERTTARRCPNCREELTPESLMCASCGADLQLIMPAGEQRSSRRPVSRSRAGEVTPPAAGWKIVRNGLGFVYLGTIIAIVTAIGVGGGAAALRMPGGISGSAGTIILAVFGVCALAGGILAFVGQCMCCAAPQESRARKLAIGAVVCVIASITIGYLTIFVLPVAGLLIAVIVRFIGHLVSLCSSVLFVYFLRRVAVFFDDDRLAQSVIGFLQYSIGWVVFGVAVLAGLFFALIRRGVGGVVIMVVLPVMLVCAVIGIIWYLRLVQRTRAVILVA